MDFLLSSSVLLNLLLDFAYLSGLLLLFCLFLLPFPFCGSILLLLFFGRSFFLGLFLALLAFFLLFLRFRALLFALLLADLDVASSAAFLGALHWHGLVLFRLQLFKLLLQGSLFLLPGSHFFVECLLPLLQKGVHICVAPLVDGIQEGRGLAIDVENPLLAAAELN